MKLKFKSILKGERIVLKKSKPTMKLAEKVFEAIDSDRKHLEPWFVWAPPTKEVKDSLKYLFIVKKEEDEGKKVEYGIYVNSEYAGNISFF